MNFKNEIYSLLGTRKKERKSVSGLGFFSQPVRYKKEGFSEKVIKFYQPVKDEKRVDFLCENHDSYVRKLSATGIHIPETSIYKIADEGKFLPVIVQNAFEQTELVRGILETCDESRFREILGLLLEDVFRFILAKTTLGFHPTLRNFAVKDVAWYFDTFPPMDMDQKKLNSIILEFSPVKIPVSGFIPGRWVNLVSDEYFSPELMLKGLAGSACRLRPEFAVETIAFLRSSIQHSQLDASLKNRTLKLIEKPPKLNPLWVSIRGLLGKEGKPNI